MNILQRAVFPKINLCTQLDLYFRVNEFADINLTNSFITLDNKGYFSTDTYFNSLSIGKWNRYTAVEDLYFSIKFKGKIKLVWYVNRLHFSPKIMKEVYLENFELSEITIPLELWEDVEDGMLAFYISAFSYSEIYDFSYKTTTKESHIVNLGIVITHFNRQKYVLPALQRLKNELLSDDNFNDKVSLYVVDNSQNLPSVEDVTIIPNENLGGSGGFSRGLIELKEKGGYTHCLFMDDDASCEVDGIKRTIALLSYAKDAELSVGGAMLREDEMFRQYENGGKFRGLLTPIKPGLDLRDVNHLLQNEKDEEIDFCGWWYFAFPISKVVHNAFPFFVRGDDIGFGLAHKFNIITLNGISSWQGDFALKHSPQTAYLDSRHQMMQHFHHFGEQGLLKLIEISARMTLRNLFTYHYDTALATILALEDIQKGRTFWENQVNMVDKRQEIVNFIKEEKIQKIPLNIIDSVHIGNPKEGTFFRIIRWLTLNGHLIPTLFFKDGIVLQPKGYGGRLREIFRYEKVLYLHSQTQTGFILSHSKKKFFNYSIRYLKAIISLMRNYKFLKKEYEESYSELTSTEFWKKQFKQEK
ncbi:glycosyl transferase [Mannheimia granulomatis]|uniref:glycosyltransferase family 2 protein n=1 Tax=Mannheimia granulomatis TaxID=85402 RepID=UPI00159D4CFF|nr:glycosyl transferase [Mannheimia granulomatis]QLB16058.1 glycosyl transferase [Mannheimia granulomatis]